MQEADVPALTEMLNAHLSTYKVHISFSEAEVKHFFLPDYEGVVYSFVVDNEQDEITDFASFYALNSSALKFEPDSAEQRQMLIDSPDSYVINKFDKVVKPGYNKVNAAYCYYNVVRNGDFERHSDLIKSLMS